MAVAGEGATARWARRVAVGLLVVVALLLAVRAGVELGAEGRLRDDGVEVVAAGGHDRSVTGYDDVEVRFTTRAGVEVRTEVAARARPELDVIRVRYDPDDPARAAPVGDPAVLWLDHLVAALAFGVAAAVVGSYPRLLAWRDRLGATT